jgi:hypothetical protein
MFECPHGCMSPKGEKSISISIIGWKRHMTAKHGSYTEEEVSKVLGTGPRNAVEGKNAFLSASEAVADPSATSDAPKPEAPKPEESTRKIKTDEVGKKFSGKLNKMKKAIADKFPTMLNQAIKDKGPEWQLSSEDSDFFAEAIENCFEVLDIDFRITPISTTLTNPLWVLLLPALVLVMIFIPKVVANARTESTESSTSAEPLPVGESVSVS